MSSNLYDEPENEEDIYLDEADAEEIIKGDEDHPMDSDDDNNDQDHAMQEEITL
ncbi:hypothetical protein EIK77_000545 [Talaromyces pinophilus]|nr:hypothetical protein EIK77_000545 [Talaromyces pinophilus]